MIDLATAVKVPLTVKRPLNMDQETLLSQVRHNLRRAIPRFTPIVARSGADAVMSVVGSGPSLSETADEIVGDTLAINAAVPYLNERNIPIDYGMMWDGNERLIRYCCRIPGTWLIASRVHPAVVDTLQALGQRILMWHALGDPGIEDVLREAGEPAGASVWGGATGMTRMVYLATRLGYHDLHCFGADSSYTGDVRTDTHVGGSIRPEGETEIVVATDDGREFRTTPWLAAQAQDWHENDLPALLKTGIRVTMHGDGLLPHVHRLTMERMGKPSLLQQHDSELVNLERRGGAPYSVGHQAMYSGPIAMLIDRPCRILDVGFGIGFGLDRMLEAGCIESYVGYEPDQASYEHVKARVGSDPRIALHNAGFSRDGCDIADYSFCIEVLEHLPDDDARREMLLALWWSTEKVLFLSTPDATRNDHGVWTAMAMEEALRDAGFRDIVRMEEQWTNLYICSR